MPSPAITVTLRHLPFSAELVHFATERARTVAASLRSVTAIQVVLQPCFSPRGDRPMFEVTVEVNVDGKRVILRHRDPDLFLAARNALDMVQAKLERKRATPGTHAMAFS